MLQANGCGLAQQRKSSEFDEVLPVSMVGLLGRAEDGLVSILVRFLEFPVEIRHKERHGPPNSRLVVVVQNYYSSLAH